MYFSFFSLTSLVCSCVGGTQPSILSSVACIHWLADDKNLLPISCSQAKSVLWARWQRRTTGLLCTYAAWKEAIMRTEHNGTWRRWFISMYCRKGPAWVPSKGQLWGTSFHRAKYGGGGGVGRGLEGKRSPAPWLNRIRNPQYQQQHKTHLKPDSKRSEYPLALEAGWAWYQRAAPMSVRAHTHTHAGPSLNVLEQFSPRTAYQQDRYEKTIKANIITPACLIAGQILWDSCWGVLSPLKFIQSHPVPLRIWNPGHSYAK